MVHLSSRLDQSFGALADVTRRGVIDRLGRADASISELAGAFDMTLTGMKKHVAILEQAGLVATRKVGRVRCCSLGADSLGDVAQWLEQHRQRWAEQFDALDRIIEQQQEDTKP